MVIQLHPELESLLVSIAKQRGITPDQLAAETLTAHLKPIESLPPVEPRDDWEQRLWDMASPSGVVPSDETLSSEGIYD